MLKLISNMDKSCCSILLRTVALFVLPILISSCSSLQNSLSSVKVPPSTVASAAQHKHSYSDYIQARLLVADGEVDLAHGALKRAIAGDPEDVYLYSAQASLYLDHGKSEQAYSLLMAALKKSPDDLTSQLLLADLLHSRGSSEDVARAMTLFHRVLQQNPDMDELYIHLTRLHLQGDDFAQATAILNQYLQRQPDALLGLMEFARLHRLQGEWHLADEGYRKVITLHPDHRRAYVLLGQLLEQGKQLDEALHIYQQGREATGEHFYFDHLISAFLMQYQRNDEADIVLDRLLANDPLDAVVTSRSCFSSRCFTTTGITTVLLARF
ncbi:MAG: tetratricopeptide repeat protein [Deltaproteobacteria bacterium]|nr:tetratricopeptide repeat protein [Deltaproteobacteria bacterium]